MPKTPPTTDRCADSAELFEFIDGGLTGSARRDLERHIDRCAACFDAVAAALGTAPQPTVRQRGEATGRYTVLRVLGEGEMGTVYAGYDPVLDRTVALKVLRRDVWPTEERKARLLREAQILAKVRHPNVVAVYDAGESGDDVYLAMELIEGVPLPEHLRRTTPHWREVVALFEQAGRGLAAAHDAGLVHRDFKPSNVLVARTGRVVVTDFGLAALAPDRSSPGSEDTPDGSLIDTRMTLTRATLGTPAYMSIEQLDGDSATPRSDQFSFCVSLVEALTGRRPFGGDTIEALREARRRGPDAEVLRCLPGPASLTRAVARGLAASPRDRHASISALSGALRRSMVRARNRVLTLVGLAVIATVGAAWQWTNRQPPQCHEPLASAWGAARRAEVEAALRGGDDGEPRPSTTRAMERLDAYASSLTDAYAAVCKTLPADVRDLDEEHAAQWACLQTRRLGLDTLTEQLATPHDGPPEHVSRLIGSLDAVDVCRSPSAAMQAMPVPHDEALAQQVLALRLELTGLRPAIAALDGAAADDLAELATRAEAVGYGPVEAEIAFQAGRLHASLGQHEQALEYGQRAYRLAVQSRHEDIARSAATGLIVTLGVLERWPEGEVWARIAEPLQRTDTQRAELAWTLGGFAYTRRDFVGARVHYEDASRYLATVADPQLLASRIDSAYGITLAELGEYREAARVLARGIDERRARLGGDHVDLISGLSNLAAVEIHIHDYEAAAIHLEQAWAIFEGAPRPPRGLATTLRLNLGVAHAGAGRWASADAWLDRALEGDDAGARAQLLATKAGLAVWRGNYGDAIATCTAAQALAQRAWGADHPQAREQEALCLAYAAEARAVDAAAAARAHELLLELGEPVADADRRLAKLLLWVLGLDGLRTGDTGEAAARFQRADELAAAEPQQGQDALMQIDLAEAIWPTSPDRARAVLDQALATVAELPPYRGAAVQLRAAALESRWGERARALDLARAAAAAAEASSAEGLRSHAVRLIARLESDG